MLPKWVHSGLAIAAIGLCLVLGQAQAASDFLPRYLEMLGYSESDIEELLSGGARLTALDDAYRLEAMGYTPEEIEQILTGGVKRRQIDATFGQKAIAEASGELPETVALTATPMDKSSPDGAKLDGGLPASSTPAG